MTRWEVLKAANFGRRVAEEETAELARYFVRTNLYTNVVNGNVDVIYGAKGSGKSAIYFGILTQEKGELFKGGVLVKSGETQRGSPAFSDLTKDPPKSEREFLALWKLYFLSLVGSALRDNAFGSKNALKLLAYLDENDLLPAEATLSSLIRRAHDYIRSLLRIKSVEAGVKLDQHTGLPSGLSGAIILGEPTASERKLKRQSLESLCKIANEALAEAGFSLWILLDRLDVAFADNIEVEEQALRALFRTYLDFAAFENVRLKIFLRNDIWNRITQSGFRESSHITRTSTITWTEPLLLNLLIRRIIKNEEIQEYYGVSEQDILSNYEAQVAFFYRVFPERVGSARQKTFDWMLSQTRDALDIAAPRELIHLLTSLQEVQLTKYEVGASKPPRDCLFDPASFTEAMVQVSRVRVEQTLYGEYPSLKPFIEAMKGKKSEQSLASLAELWQIDREKASLHTQRLVEIGFVEATGSKRSPRFKIPPLYQVYLELSKDGQRPASKVSQSNE
jgi:hypothetical protein